MHALATQFRNIEMYGFLVVKEIPIDRSSMCSNPTGSRVQTCDEYNQVSLCERPLMEKNVMYSLNDELFCSSFTASE